MYPTGYPFETGSYRQGATRRTLFTASSTWQRKPTVQGGSPPGLASKCHGVRSGAHYVCKDIWRWCQAVRNALAAAGPGFRRRDRTPLQLSEGLRPVGLSTRPRSPLATRPPRRPTGILGRGEIWLREGCGIRQWCLISCIKSAQSATTADRKTINYQKIALPVRMYAKVNPAEKSPRVPVSAQPGGYT